MTTKRVLVVDNDAEFRSLVQHVLGESGYEVVEARTGEEARRQLRDSGAELAIVDESLPDGPGTQVVAWLRKAGSNVPVVLVSAFRRDAAMPRATELGISATLRKPITGAALLSQVTTLLPVKTALEFDESSMDLELMSTSAVAQAALSGGWSVVPQTAPPSKPEESEEAAAVRVLTEIYGKTLNEKVKELAHAIGQVRANASDVFALAEATRIARKLKETSDGYRLPEVAAAAGGVLDALTTLATDKMQTGALLGKASEKLRELRQLIAGGEQPAAAPPRAPASPRPPAAPAPAANEPASAPPPPQPPAYQGPRVQLSQSIASPFAEKLLVVDDDPEFLDLVKTMSRRHMLSAIPVKTTAEAMQAARMAKPDAALIDLNLDPSGSDLSFLLVKELRSLPGLERLPIGFVSTEATMEARVAAAEAGASFFLQKPIDAIAFGTAARQLMARIHSERPLILVADTAAFAPYVSALVQQIGMRAKAVADLSTLPEEVAAHSAELLILNTALKDPTAFDLARAIRMDPKTQDFPIVFLSGKATPQMRIAVYEAGGDDILQEPILAEELLARVKLLVERSQLRRNRALVDPLTGLRHRGAFLQDLGHLPKSTVAMLGIDGLDTINVKYGYAAGDQVMAALGRILRRSFMSDVLRGRWGDDKCVVAFPGEDAETVSGVLHRTLRDFGTQPFKLNDGRTFHATFSAGIVSPKGGDLAENLLRAAEGALWSTRAAGAPGQIKTG